MFEFDPKDENAFPHKEITEAIIGSAFEVYNQLGHGFLERGGNQSCGAIRQTR